MTHLQGCAFGATVPAEQGKQAKMPPLQGVNETDSPQAGTGTNFDVLYPSPEQLNLMSQEQPVNLPYCTVSLPSQL